LQEYTIFQMKIGVAPYEIQTHYMVLCVL